MVLGTHMADHQYRDRCPEGVSRTVGKPLSTMHTLAGEAVESYAQCRSSFPIDIV